MSNNIVRDKIEAILLDESNIIVSPLEEVSLKTAKKLQKELSFSMKNLYEKSLCDILNVNWKTIIYVDCSLNWNNNFILELTRSIIDRLTVSKEVLLDSLLYFIKENPLFFNSNCLHIFNFEEFAYNYIYYKMKYLEKIDDQSKDVFYINQLYFFEKLWEKFFISQSLGKWIVLLDKTHCLDSANIKIINQLMHRIWTHWLSANILLYFKINNWFDRWMLDYLDWNKLIKDQDYLNINIYL